MGHAILQDVRGVWWLISRDKYRRVGMYEFRAGQEGKKDAERYAKTLLANGWLKASVKPARRRKRSVRNEGTFDDIVRRARRK